MNSETSNTRKFKLKINTNRPYGVGTYDFDMFKQVIEQFSGSTTIYEKREFSYNEITLNDLSLLTHENFHQRVSDFLMYIDVNSVDEFSRLLYESTYYTIENDPNFVIPECQLNINDGSIIQKSSTEIEITGGFGIVDGNPLFKVLKTTENQEDYEWTDVRFFTLDSDYDGEYYLYVKHIYYGYDVIGDCINKRNFVLNDYAIVINKTAEFGGAYPNGESYKGFDVEYSIRFRSVIYEPNVDVAIYSISETNENISTSLLFDNVTYLNNKQIKTIKLTSVPYKQTYVVILKGCDGTGGTLSGGIRVKQGNVDKKIITVEQSCPTYICGLNDATEIIISQITANSIQISNIGTPVGTVYYRVYMANAAPSEWVTKSLFSSIYENTNYILEIKEMIGNVEICSISKQFKTNDYTINLSYSTQNVSAGLLINYSCTAINGTVKYLPLINITTYSITNSESVGTKTIKTGIEYINNNTIYIEYNNNVSLFTHTISTNDTTTKTKQVTVSQYGCGGVPISLDGGIRVSDNNTLNESIINEFTCDEILCLLNSDPIITQLATSVIISNYGDANGTTEFRIYKKNTTPPNWVTSPIFNNFLIDPYDVFVAEIRDNYYNNIICSVSKEFMFDDYDLIFTTISTDVGTSETTVSFKAEIKNNTIINNYPIELSIYSINNSNSSANSIVKMKNINGLLLDYETNNTLIKKITLPNYTGVYSDYFKVSLNGCDNDITPILGGVLIKAENLVGVQKTVERVCPIPSSQLDSNFKILIDDYNKANIIEYGTALGICEYRVTYKSGSNIITTQWYNISVPIDINVVGNSFTVYIKDSIGTTLVGNVSRSFITNNYSISESISETIEPLNKGITKYITLFFTQPTNSGVEYKIDLGIELFTYIIEGTNSNTYIFYRDTRFDINGESIDRFPLNIDTINNQLSTDFEFYIGIDCMNIASNGTGGLDVIITGIYNKRVSGLVSCVELNCMINDNFIVRQTATNTIEIQNAGIPNDSATIQFAVKRNDIPSTENFGTSNVFSNLTPNIPYLAMVRDSLLTSCVKTYEFILNTYSIIINKVSETGDDVSKTVNLTIENQSIDGRFVYGMDIPLLLKTKILKDYTERAIVTLIVNGYDYIENNLTVLGTHVISRDTSTSNKSFTVNIDGCQDIVTLHGGLSIYDNRIPTVPKFIGDITANVACTIPPCRLSDLFFVTQTGEELIKVSGYGTANGIAQMRIHYTSSTGLKYTNWTNITTNSYQLPLDRTSDAMTVYIRDYYNNMELCSVNKNIVLNDWEVRVSRIEMEFDSSKYSINEKSYIATIRIIEKTVLFGIYYSININFVTEGLLNQPHTYVRYNGNTYIMGSQQPLRSILFDKTKLSDSFQYILGFDCGGTTIRTTLNAGILVIEPNNVTQQLVESITTNCDFGTELMP